MVVLNGISFTEIEVTQVEVAPFWMLALPIPGAGDITRLEQEIAADLGVLADPAPGGSLFYNTEADARGVAIGMMRQRPDLCIGVCGSEPGMPSYVPIANTTIVTTIRRHD